MKNKFLKYTTFACLLAMVTGCKPDMDLNP